MIRLTQKSPAIPNLFEFQKDSPGEPQRLWDKWGRIPVGWGLLLLVVACLIPRICMAVMVEPVCHDGYYYISLGAAFRNGDWAKALSYLNLNIYPVILLGLNSLGLEWILAGKLWSVVISSLAVLPLFGWVRRLFSDQVAWAAGILYSVHAEFVEMSSEPIRDPTFWFLFNFGLYSMMRAITEVKIRWFLLTGLTVTLAIHTRSEGWLLAIPFAMWFVRQFVIHADRRWRLAFGSLCCAAVLPTVILIVNLTLFRGETEWQFGRLSHFVTAWEWAEQQWNPEEGITEPKATAEHTEVASTKNPAKPAELSPSTRLAVSIVTVPMPIEPPQTSNYFRMMSMALEPINLGLFVFGMCWSWRRLADWDRLALFILAAIVAVAVWIVYEQHGAINGRYFFPMYLALVPYFGIGYLVVFHALWKAAEWMQRTWLKPEYSVAFLIVLAIGLGWGDALTTNHEARELESNLGHWVSGECGPFERILVDPESLRMGYHAQIAHPAKLHNLGTLDRLKAEQSYDLLILAKCTTPEETLPAIKQLAEQIGLTPVKIPETQPGHDRFFVWTKATKKPEPGVAGNAHAIERR